jgi:signal transduction histidine kinase/ligand-binding sensor domain-containing protein
MFGRSSRSLLLVAAAWLGLCGVGRSADGAATDAYALKLWTVEDRLPGSPVVGVAQAADGYLWLAARSQLIRFNGAEFAEAPVPAEVRARTGEWRGVFCGRADGVWVYGAKGVARFRGGAWQAWPAEAGEVSVGRILGMLETPDGVVRAVAERGLLEAAAAPDDATTQFEARLCPVPPDDRATLGAVTGAAADGSGRIWMTAWNGLVEYAGGRFDDQSMRLPDFLVEAAGGVHAGRSGRLWVHGPNGVAFREHNVWTPVGFPENAGMATVMLEVSDGSLWMGNPTGLYRWQEGAWRRIAEQDTPGSLSVNTLIEDRDGVVWAACDGGLLRIRKKTVGTLRAEGAATSGTGYALWRTPERGTWVGYKGRAVRLTSEEGRLLQTVYLDTDVPVSALLQDAAGRVWLGTLGGGLFLYHAGGLTLVTQQDYSLPMVHTIHALLEDPQLGVLVGTPQGLMRVGPAGELEAALIDGLRLDEPVRALYRDADGTLWVCCERTGVVRVQRGASPQVVGREEGLEGDPRVVCRDSRGNLWVGTTSGLFGVGGGRALPLGRQAGVFDDAVLQISEDADRRLWLGTKRGLLCVFIEDLEQLGRDGPGRAAGPIRMLHLGVADGLAGERCMGGAAGAGKGNLWFAFENGVAVVDPRRVAFSASPPQVAIERVLVNGQKVFDNLSGRRERLAVPPGFRNLAFHFAALSPGAPDSIRYRTRIDGVREGWSPVQAERSAVFEWLPPGEYTLRVIAEAGGVWNLEGASVHFEVGAFFWQTAWFYLLLATALAAVVFFIARWMLWHRYQLQMAMLKREEALAHERARISRDIHDDLGNGLSVVATLSELAHNDVDKGAVHKRLDQIYDVANELARNVDEIVWAVNPANDGWEPFLSYFEQYTEYFLGHSGLRFHFCRPDDLVAHTIASKTRHHLLLAVREAVGNVLKHASAKQVRIGMRVEGNELEVCVEDDGVGFDTAKSAGVGHDGLANMARRMREAGGSIQVSSAVGRGTRITFRVPVEEARGGGATRPASGVPN